MFKFKLDPVLRLREKMEDHKKRELGEAIRQEEVLRYEQQVLTDKKNALLEEAQEERRDTIDLRTIRLCHMYSGVMDEAIKAKTIEVEKASSEVHLKRDELLEAVKERKILDNLKGIYQEIYIEEEKHIEQRVTDDMVTYQYGKKGKE